MKYLLLYGLSAVMIGAMLAISWYDPKNPLWILLGVAGLAVKEAVYKKLKGLIERP